MLSNRLGISRNVGLNPTLAVWAMIGSKSAVENRHQKTTRGIQLLKGRCLCGEITYTLTSELLFLYHCHCNECRRFSGSSNATNASIVGSDLTINDPNERLTKYTLQQGGRYFCSGCGSPIYSNADGGDFPSLHCGSIIDPPDKEIDANLWSSEKCPWSKIDTETQNFEKAPE